MNHRSYLLELRSRDEFRPKTFSDAAVTVARARAEEMQLCRSLWSEVGRGFWSEREDWSAADWERHLANAAISFWIARRIAEAIGFFELVRDGSEMKIEGFGLLSRWRNKGLGGGLLSDATARAFDLGANRVWLHTATDDHPHALTNYQQRGYRIYHEESLKEPMPDCTKDSVERVKILRADFSHE